MKDTSTIVGNKRFYLTTDITITETLDITVDNVVLCLNGHTITLNKDGPVIEVQSGKTFTLTDCTDAGMLTHAEDKTGCGVKVNGTFKMYGGNITGNRGNQSGAGGGVYVALGGTFNMHGGKITNNRGTYSLVGTTSRTYGGGVFVATNETTGSTFNMYGGTIGGTGEDDGNSAHYGGGVYVGDSGHFTMTGGSITGNSANYGSGVYVYADSISVGGNANIIGNENKASMSAEKEDNVYLALNTKVSVNSGFNGSVGINVDVDEWKTIPTDETESNGKKWVVVAGDGLGAAVTGNKITYDNGEFSINAGTGKLSCLHVCDITYNSPYYKCKICNENVNLKTEFKNRAGNIIKTQYYATARAAFEAAQNNCVITMLTAAEFESYTWDLGGKTVAPNADHTLKNVTVKNGTLNLGYTKGYENICIQEMVVESGAAVNVDVNNSRFGGEPSLTVNSGGKVVFNSGRVDYLKVEKGGTVALKGGAFERITVAEGMTCADLLADGYAFFESNDKNAALVIANKTMLSSRTTPGNKQYYWVKLHSCDFNNHPTCGCGRECPHNTIGSDDKCTDCKTLMDGILVRKTTGGTTVTRKFATFNEAVKSIETGDTDITIKLMENAELLDTDPAAEDDNTTILFPCTIDLNGKR